MLRRSLPILNTQNPKIHKNFSWLPRSEFYKINKASELETIIIGGGMGGLSCAAHLLKSGCPVTILEKQPSLGGYVGSFTRGKYTFDQVTHVTVYSAWKKLFEEMGIYLEEADHRIIEELIRIKGKNYDIGIRDIEGLCKNIGEQFPEEKENVRKLCELSMQIYKEGIDIIVGKDMKMNPFLLPFQQPTFTKHITKTLRTAIEKYTKNEDIINILFSFPCVCSMTPPNECSAIFPLQILGMGLKSHLEYFPATAQMLVDKYQKVIEEKGGRILMGKEVKEIIVEGEQVRGVKLADETFLPAKAVVSNLNPISTFHDLLPNKSQKSVKFLDKLMRREIGLSNITIFLGLNQDINGILPNYETVVLSEGTIEDQFKKYSQGEFSDSSYLASNYSYISNPSPPGTSVFTLLIPTSIAPWEEYAEDYRKGIKGKYNKFKNELADIIIERAERDLVPGLRDMIEVKEIATPLTNIRYTGNYMGAALGFKATPKTITQSLPHKTHIKGLYLSSAYCAGSYGISPLNGKMTCKAMRKDYGF